MTVAKRTQVVPQSEPGDSTNVPGVFSKRKENAHALASGYTWEKRALEYASVIAFSTGFGICLYRVYEHITLSNWWMMAIACALSMSFSDIISGLLHWGADTWGSLETPVVNKFIRSFREHHVDPFGITRHDVIETNGDNCLALVAIVWLLVRGSVTPGDNEELFALVFTANFAFWTVLANQIHKWAHQVKPPALIALLQDYRIILNRKDHQVHHHTPFDRYYCITTGWLNPVVASFGFWKRMELSITAITGEKPRMDDAFWTVQTDSQESASSSTN